ncbi:MAG TPA: prolipoprotein diacylglyceryl transferase family protein [Anaerolineales bacterium]|nr:prolipoprotein diacylglyceryl transferase family protein [Anaerolineales bacterium]
MLALFRNFFAPPRDLILVVLAAWLGLSLSERRATRYNLNKDAIDNLILFGFVAYVMGGRVFYALEHLPDFAQSPLSLDSFSIDLFDPIGALAAALIVVFVFGPRANLPFWRTLDTLTPFFAVLAIGMSLSHIAENRIFGTPTNVPWGIYTLDQTRHPIQIYELLASLLIFGLLWLPNLDSSPGSLFLTFTALTAAAQLFFEAFHGDSTLVFGDFRLNQILAWIVLATAFVLYEWLRTIHEQESNVLDRSTPRQ